MKGKRQEGSIEKELQRLMGDLALSKETDHPQYGYKINAYVNDVSSKIILDFLRLLMNRIRPSDKPELLLRFIDELSVGDMDEMRKVFGEDTPLCDWNFWKDMYIKTGRKQNGDVVSAVDLKTEDNKKPNGKKPNGKKISK